jgi:hypothetical protein
MRQRIICISDGKLFVAVGVTPGAKHRRRDPAIRN